MAIPIGVDPGSTSQSSNIPTVSAAASTISVNSSTAAPVRELEAGPSSSVVGFDFADSTTAALDLVEVSRDRAPAGPVAATSAIDREGSRSTSVASGKEREEELKLDLSKRRREWNDDKFNGKPGYVTAATEKIMSEAPVIADLRTNVIVKDEFTVITGLSSEMSKRYQRSENSIMVTLSHSSCLMIGGTFDPAYILTISAIPEYVQEATNMRNTHFIQRFMTEMLSVSASRGIVRFIAVPESMLGIKGMTVRGQIVESEGGLKRVLTNRSYRKSLTTTDKRKSSTSAVKEDQIKRNSSTKSVKSIIKNNGSGSSVASPHLALPSKSNGAHHSSSHSSANGASGASKGLATPAPSPNGRPSSARKSILKMTGQDQAVPPPPPVPEETSTSRVGKRRSFVSMFKRDRTA